MSWLSTEGQKMGPLIRIKWHRLEEIIQILLQDVYPVRLKVCYTLHEKSEPKIWGPVLFVNDIHTSLLL